MRDFLWERCEEGKGVHLVRWDTVSLPKEKGGLAIGNIVARNIALLGKWLWRFSIEVIRYGIQLLKASMEFNPMVEILMWLIEAIVVHRGNPFLVCIPLCLITFR